MIRLKSILIKLYIGFQEKKYTIHNMKLKYILKREKSDKLIVIFSGFPNKGEKARYNYMRTLKDLKCNKLFILDDFGYEGRGSYYLGENNDFFIEESVISLINKTKRDLNIKNTVFLGSSKGAYASLYFGIKYGAEYIISGAPQYYVEDYLNKENHIKY